MVSVEVYRDNDGVSIYKNEDTVGFMNNAQVRRYVVICHEPKFDYEFIDDDIIIVSCCGIPFQEYKRIGRNHLSSTGVERWKKWGPKVYNMSVEEYLKLSRWARWFPQKGYSACHVYDTDYPTCNSFAARDSFQLKEEYAEYSSVNPWSTYFYDYEYTAERYIKGFPSTPILVDFEKKYNILSIIEEMIASDKNILDS